jgi:hypothetical protein
MHNANSHAFTLRDLPGPTRGVIGVFLVAIGCGYFAGLVQLHHQHAAPGQLLPGFEEAKQVYSGGDKAEPKSKIQHLLEADETKPFNGQGTMKPAFTTKSERKWAENLAKMPEAEQKKLLQEREGDRLALIDWLKHGAKKEAYDADEFALTAPLVLSDEFVSGDKDAEGQATKVKLASIITERCVRCHMENGADKNAEKFPLDEWPKLAPYLKAVEAPGPMEIKKLAQTTHVHLIGFTMMFFLTGLIFSLTSYPGWVRAILAPWPMFFQVIDISCWWLGRYEPLAAQAIIVTGGLVAIGLAIHILGGLLDLTGIVGKKTNHG